MYQTNHHFFSVSALHSTVLEYSQKLTLNDLTNSCSTCPQNLHNHVRVLKTKSQWLHDFATACRTERTSVNNPAKASEVSLVFLASQHPSLSSIASAFAAATVGANIEATTPDPFPQNSMSSLYSWSKE